MTTCRPWEASALAPPSAPAGAVSPVPAATPPGALIPPPAGGSVAIYNRVVSIFRMVAPEIAVGPDPYSGDIPATETMLFPNTAASITLRSPGRAGKSSVPTDISTKPAWVIILPLAGGIVQYDVRDRDIVVDDEQYRYGVEAAVWSVFGYTLECIRLEV